MNEWRVTEAILIGCADVLIPLFAVCLGVIMVRWLMVLRHWTPGK